MFCISPAVAAVMMPDVMHLCHMEDDRPAAPFSLSAGSFPVLMLDTYNKKSHIVQDELGVMAADEQKPRNINSRGEGQFSVEPR